MGILVRWGITALALLALPYVLDGMGVDGVVPAAIGAACLVFIHLVVKPIVKILTLPINILSLGIFSVVLNGLFFWFVIDIIDGLSVKNFTVALVASLAISLVNWVISKFTKHDD